MYKGIGIEHGICVSGENAFNYALERCLHGNENDQIEFRNMLEEWFYSGEWVKEEEDFDKQRV